MIDLGPHAGFILAAYGGVALALFGVIAWTLLDARSVARKLARLETARPPR